MKNIRLKRLGTYLVRVLFIIFIAGGLLACALPPDQEVNNSSTVYITETGSKYHLGSCRYLHSSKIPIPLSDAIDQGYSPCSVCDPPR